MSHCRLFLCWPSRWPAKYLTAAHSITHHGDSSILLPKLITGARTSEVALLLLCGGEDGLGYRAFSQDLGGETWRKTVTIQTLPNVQYPPHSQTLLPSPGWDPTAAPSIPTWQLASKKPSPSPAYCGAGGSQVQVEVWQFLNL